MSETVWNKLAHFGTFLQGLAAAVLAVVAIFQGSELVEKITDLKTSTDAVKSGVERLERVSQELKVSSEALGAKLNEINNRVIKLEIPSSPPTPKNPDQQVKLEEQWSKQLAAISEQPEEGQLIYMPARSEVVKRLSKIVTPEPEKRDAEIVRILKSAIRPNSPFPEAKVQTDIRVGPHRSIVIDSKVSGAAPE